MSIADILKEYIINDDAIMEPKTDKDEEISFDDVFWNAGLSHEKGFTAEDADPEELSKGIIVEMEHTTDKKISEKIALDHLAEIPDYYTRLAKMEADAGVDVDEKMERYS